MIVGSSVPYRFSCTSTIFYIEYSSMQSNAKPTYLQSIWKNIRSDLKESSRILNIILFTCIAVLLWAFEFSPVTTIVGVLLPPLLMYYLFSYLTALPILLVLILAFAPRRISMPILLVSFIAMFVI